MTDHEIQELIASQIKTASEPLDKPRFDATINLGHILTIMTVLGGGFAAYISSHDSSVASRYDIEANKRAIALQGEAIKSIATTQATATNSLEKLTWIVESLQREHANPK